MHRARLNGEEVVIKVQRPGLRELFEVDLRNIRVLAVWLQAADPKSDGAARDWVAIYDECSKILYEVRPAPRAPHCGPPAARSCARRSRRRSTRMATCDACCKTLHEACTQRLQPAHLPQICASLLPM